MGRPPSIVHEETLRLLRDAVRLEVEARKLLGSAGRSVLESGRRGPGEKRTFLDGHSLVEAAIEADLSAGNGRPEEARKILKEAGLLRWAAALGWDSIAHKESKGRPDLLQEARIGLFEAAKRFDPNRKIKFSTYGRWWARAYVTRAFDRDTSLPISHGRKEKIRTIRRWENAGRTVHDAAVLMGVDDDELRQLLLAETARVPSSLDLLADLEGDRFEPEGSLVRITDLETRIDIDQVRRAMDRCLDRRQNKILRLRYRLDTGPSDEETSYAEIGRTLRFSRERVRQIERAALVLLREELRASSSELRASSFEPLRESHELRASSFEPLRESHELRASSFELLREPVRRSVPVWDSRSDSEWSRTVPVRDSRSDSEWSRTVPDSATPPASVDGYEAFVKAFGAMDSKSGIRG